MKELTDKQKRFCEEYAIDLNSVRAYRAVYTGCKSDKTASAAAGRLMAKDSIRKYIQTLCDKVAEKAMISAEDVLRDLIAVKDRCMQAVPVKVWSIEQHAYIDSDAEYTFDSKGANTALKLIGDHLGMFQQRLEIDASNVGVVIQNDIPKDRNSKTD